MPYRDVEALEHHVGVVLDSSEFLEHLLHFGCIVAKREVEIRFADVENQFYLATCVAELYLGFGDKVFVGEGQAVERVRQESKGVDCASGNWVVSV